MISWTNRFKHTRQPVLPAFSFVRQGAFAKGALHMQAEDRRRTILKILQESAQPVSASVLAGQLSVSRQIIVGDIALLRAGGEEILATPRGYCIQRSGQGLLRRVAVRHSSEAMEAELNAIVDQGCTVVDVIVEHPLYGQLTGSLQLSNRYDVAQFIARSQSADAMPLSQLTDGLHLHTLLCSSESAFQRVTARLREQGILLEESAENS